MNDNDLRDCFAMFALNGILSCNYDVGEEPAVLAYKYADEMLEARKPKEEAGITAVKRARKSSEKRDA
jgi:hypothetical protein